MRLDLFSKDDSVLLLGEGNFSFSVCLHKHNLPIKIVATCFEKDPKFERQLQNIDYLKSHKVPVLLNVDATKLRQNEHFSGAKFSKIVFNFPHVGGKMKIHLNRELLRKVFENCSHILKEDGRMIVSLCRGQGGTPADRPRRNWHDSWQVTEMAAHGDFVLTAVEPFFPHNFIDYECIGYRSQHVRFHLEGALVHVFAKRDPPYHSPRASLPSVRLSAVPLTHNSDVLVPIIYSELYQNNPNQNPDSTISFLKRHILQNLIPNSKWELKDDDEMPFHVEHGQGASCRVNGVLRKLRSTPLDIFPDLLESLVDGNPEENVLFTGTFFSPLEKDFSTPPLQINFVLTGANLWNAVTKFLRGLIDLFDDAAVVLTSESLDNSHGKDCTYPKAEELVLQGASRRVVAAILYKSRCGRDIAVVRGQTICEYFFGVGWREIWAYKTEVVVEDKKPRLKASLLYPSEYKFDVTLKYTEQYSDDQVYHLLWLAAGQLIEGFETVSEYSSGEGWSSKCYRLTYKSLDRPLFRGRVIDIHSRIVCQILELGLNVTIG